MIRALFILLAIVSLVLGFVLNNPLLYVAAGALLLVSAVLMVVVAASRRRKAKRSYAAPQSAQDELAALGISNVRPKSSSAQMESGDEDVMVVSEPEMHVRSQQPQSVAQQDASSNAPQPVAAAAADGLPSDGILEIRPIERPRRTQSTEDADVAADAGKDGAVQEAELDSTGRTPPPSEQPRSGLQLRREVLDPYLQSMQAAVGANTVCLLRQDNGALKYHIEGIISRNAYARTKGHFSTRIPLVTPAIQKKRVITFRVGEKGIPTSNLAYYVEPIAVRQIAVTEVPQRSSEATYLLLADSMEEGGLADEKKHGLLARFARLLASILDGGEPIGAGEVEADRRPRRDIIAEEMALAREESRPLALILVYLNQAEEIAAEGDEAVNEAEAIFEGRLRDAASGRRVEHFGELIYAIFFVGDAAAAEEYVVELPAALKDESGPLAGGVSIGVAFLKKRHDTPEAFRADANEALREAFETGASTILE